MSAMKTIAYSDGDVENVILDLLQRAPELSSHTNIACEHYDNWGIRYHLNASRGNLLRPFDFTGLDVLELGAGMGGVSRFIAESARHLTFVEGTERRYKAAQARLRDLDNWEGFVANIQDFETNRKFDVVCLIGVFEYSELYIDSETPYAWVLERLKFFLKEKGVVIVALENRNGLKYFCGASEDHTGGCYDGICGYSTSKTPRTFSYKQMKDFFEQSSFAHTVSFFPHPDYKNPRVILSEEMLAEYPNLAGQMMATYPSEDYLGAHRRVFSESLAWESIAESGLLREMSNSFLFLATTDKNSTVLQHLLTRTETCLAWGYASDRRNPTITEFCRVEGGLEARKYLAFTSADVKTVTPICMGNLYALYLLRKMRFEGINATLEELLTFFAWGFSYFQTDDSAFLKPEALDALPHNIIRKDGLFFPFDLEWKAEDVLPKSWYIYRVIFVLEGQYSLFSMGEPNFSYQECYEHLCSLCAVTPDFNGAVQREDQFQQSACGVFSQKSVVYLPTSLSLTSRLKALLRRMAPYHYERARLLKKYLRSLLFA